MPASCIIHRQRRADAGAAPLRPPGPHTPNRERGGQGSDTRRRLRATPDLLKPDAAKATLRKAGGQVESERAPRVSSEIRARVPAQRAPWRPCGDSLLDLLAQVPRKQVIYRTGDPEHVIHLR